jgi:hypothetical protein
MNDTCYARSEKRIHHGFAFLFYIIGQGFVGRVGQPGM